MVIYKGNDLFNAVVVSLSLLGGVFQIPESAFNLKEMMIMTTLKEQIDQCNKFIEPHEYAKVWIDFISNLCLVFTADITDNPLQALKDYTWLNYKMYMFELMQWIIPDMISKDYVKSSWDSASCFPP